MILGANTKKSADDITSNDRGEDEGIFCFFKARPWCMNINFLIFIIIIIIIVIVIAVISTWFLVPYLEKHTSMCLFIFFLKKLLSLFFFLKSKLAYRWLQFLCDIGVKFIPKYVWSININIIWNCMLFPPVLS